MIKKWPIRLYELPSRVGVIDLSAVKMIGNVDRWNAEKWRFYVYITFAVNDKNEHFLWIQDVDKESLEGQREKIYAAWIEYHSRIGECRDIVPEEDKQETIDPISTIDLTQSTENP